MADLKSLYQPFARTLASKNIHLGKSLVYCSGFKQELAHNIDFVRYVTLELCRNEIIANETAGSTAELGVYKGEFAKRINQLFPDRKLYLFDTFEGFDSKNVNTEQVKDFSTGKQDFSDTSVELVLGKMKYRQNCIVKKGYFPDTAVGISDTFCFVSLDADLYEPILNGLNYFYPRLENKGYIFVHDFNNDLYKGAREAVIEYCAKNKVSYVPIPDIGGSAIITK